MLTIKGCMYPYRVPACEQNPFHKKIAEKLYYGDYNKTTIIH